MPVWSDAGDMKVISVKGIAALNVAQQGRFVQLSHMGRFTIGASLQLVLSNNVEAPVLMGNNVPF
jgi:hypothetical protein